MAMGFTSLSSSTLTLARACSSNVSAGSRIAPIINCNATTNSNSIAVRVSPEENEKVVPLPTIGRRHGLSACFTALTLSVAQSALAAILEADDDEELLERVKKDREKRLQRQGVINSSNKETGYLQELVYKLSKVGQAIEKNDFFAASSVLGPSLNTDWVQNVNIAFAKLSSSPEEKMEVDSFNSSLASLILSVDKHDSVSSKLAFVSSASALEKWIDLTGLVGQLKGL